MADSGSTGAPPSAEVSALGGSAAAGSEGAAAVSEVGGVGSVAVVSIGSSVSTLSLAGGAKTKISYLEVKKKKSN